MTPTFTLLLDNRRVKKSTGAYPVKLRVTSGRSTRYYTTVFDLAPDPWRKLSAPRINAKLQTVKDNLRAIEHGAEAVLKALVPFSFAAFEQDFILNHPSFHQRRSYAPSRLQ